MREDAVFTDLNGLKEWCALAGCEVVLQYRTRSDLPWCVYLQQGGVPQEWVRGEGEDLPDAFEAALLRYGRAPEPTQRFPDEPEPEDGFLENDLDALDRWAEGVGRPLRISYRCSTLPRFRVVVGGWTKEGSYAVEAPTLDALAAAVEEAR